MLAESLMGFTLGFAVVLFATLAWKGIGWAQERRTTEDAHRQEIGNLVEMYQSLQRQIVELRSAPTGAGAADAAIAQIASRLSKLEKQQAEQDLTILDTAERVAHKLQDRQRKRNGAKELEEDEEIPADPNLLLARARQFYGAAARDEGQMQLDGIPQ